jgi:hypothetical protein
MLWFMYHSKAMAQLNTKSLDFAWLRGVGGMQDSAHAEYCGSTPLWLYQSWSSRILPDVDQ